MFTFWPILDLLHNCCAVIKLKFYTTSYRQHLCNSVHAYMAMFTESNFTSPCLHHCNASHYVLCM